MKKLLSNIILFIMYILILSCVDSYCNMIDMDIIAKIESNYNEKAVSYRGAKYGRGMYQVSEICLADYNNLKPRNLPSVRPSELFYKDTCLMVASWYFKRLEGILTQKGIEVTEENLLWAYNAGPGMVMKQIMPKETKQYIIKYKKIQKERNRK